MGETIRLGNSICKLYLCNGKRCGENHNCGECHLTKDVKYAKNGDFGYSLLDTEDGIFVKVPNNIKAVKEGEDLYLIEEEKNVEEREVENNN